MTHARQDLNDLIGSRICHDLISPLGAIGNGIELLTLSAQGGDAEMALITESIYNANARIRFFRIAFGAAPADQAVGETEIRSILRDMHQTGRIAIVWQPRGEKPRREVKLAFLLLQCFETALPWGGHVAVSEIAGEWAIHGTAERMQIDPDLWGMLSMPHGTREVAASKVQFALSPIAAESAGRRLIVESSDSSIRVRF